MRKTILFFTGMLLAFQGFSQNPDNETILEKSTKLNFRDTVAWIYNGTFNLGFNEGALHNWPAGGELASLAWTGLFDGSLVHYNGRKVWSNNLTMNYGTLYAYSNDFEPRKTDDRIDLTSRYGYRVSEASKFYFTGLFNAQSQFTKGYDYENPEWQSNPTSKFLSPLYLTLAPGIEYRHSDMFSVFFSPAALRATFVSRRFTSLRPEGAYGVKQGKTSRFELGAYMSARFQKQFNKIVSFRTRLDLYSNYLAHNIKENGVIVKHDNPGNIDIFWDNYLTFTFAKFLAVNIGATFAYDNDVPYHKTYIDANGLEVPKDEPMKGLGWWQMKQILSIGFNYKF